MAACFLLTSLFLGESSRELQRQVGEFYRVRLRRKLKMSVGKSKVMDLERMVVEVCD